MSTSSALRPRDAALLALLLLVGGWLRFHPWHVPKPVGDENVYASYVEWTQHNGLWSYPDLVEEYLAHQEGQTDSLLPPTRLSLVASGFLVSTLTGWSAIDSLRFVTRCASVLLLGLVWLLGWHLRGPLWAHGATLLLAVSPLQLHSARIAFVDLSLALATTFALLCVVFFHLGRVRAAAIGLVFALPALVLTKESAVISLGALGLILSWLAWQADPAARRTLLLGCLGGALLTATLVAIFFGSLDRFAKAVSLLAAQTRQSPYSITHQSGPWLRYLLDYLLISPVVLLGFLAVVGRVWREGGEAGRMLLVFLALSVLPMALLGQSGLNLRFALPWDPVIRLVLAAGLASAAPARAGLFLVLLAAADLAHYLVYFTDGRLYDPVTFTLLRSLGIYRGEYAP